MPCLHSTNFSPLGLDFVEDMFCSTSPRLDPRKSSLKNLWSRSCHQFATTKPFLPFYSTNMHSIWVWLTRSCMGWSFGLSQVRGGVNPCLFKAIQGRKWKADPCYFHPLPPSLLWLISIVSQPLHLILIDHLTFIQTQSIQSSLIYLHISHQSYPVHLP